MAVIIERQNGEKIIEFARLVIAFCYDPIMIRFYDPVMLSLCASINRWADVISRKKSGSVEIKKICYALFSQKKLCPLISFTKKVSAPHFFAKNVSAPHFPTAWKSPCPINFFSSKKVCPIIYFFQKKSLPHLFFSWKKSLPYQYFFQKKSRPLCRPAWGIPQ